MKIGTASSEKVPQIGHRYTNGLVEIGRHVTQRCSLNICPRERRKQTNKQKKTELRHINETRGARSNVMTCAYFTIDRDRKAITTSR